MKRASDGKFVKNAVRIGSNVVCIIEKGLDFKPFTPGFTPMKVYKVVATPASLEKNRYNQWGTLMECDDNFDWQAIIIDDFGHRRMIRSRSNKMIDAFYHWEIVP